MASSYPSSPAGFEHRFPANRQNTIHSLGKSQSLSGSQWSSRHLEACRVLLQTHHGNLPILEPHLAAAEAIVDEFPDKVADLTRFSSSQIGRIGHQELREHGGIFDAFLVALADVSRISKPASIANSRVRRIPKAIDRPEYVTGEGLSSPTAVGSSDHTQSSPYTPQSQGPLEFEDQLDRTKHEAVSADMAGQFISSVLDRLSGQTSREHRIKVFKAPTIFELGSSNLACTCQDDGAMVRREFNVVVSRWVSHESFLCSLEAKSRYTKADASDIGVVSDPDFAQQVCEILGSVMSMVKEGEYEDLEPNERCRFLISVYQTNITFLYANFTE